MQGECCTEKYLHYECKCFRDLHGEGWRYTDAAASVDKTLHLTHSVAGTQYTVLILLQISCCRGISYSYTVQRSTCNDVDLYRLHLSMKLNNS